MQIRMQNEQYCQFNSLKRTALRLKWEIRCKLTQYPAVYLPLIRLRRKQNQNAVDGDTEIVIDGYPRSGNTFAVVAFKEAQNREVQLGHHLHAPAQIIWAVKHNIPTLVLIRNPVDAIASFLVYEGYLTVNQALREYIRYYKTIIPLRRGFVVADFREVTDDFGCSIQRVNSYFGTSFSVFKHTEDNVKRCFARIDEFFKSVEGYDLSREILVGRPSVHRKPLKAFWRDNIHSKRYSAALTEAERIYRYYTLPSSVPHYENGD